MELKIISASGRAICRGEHCKGLPEFIIKLGVFRYNNNRIRKDTQCLMITMWSAAGGTTAYYCSDCMNNIYVEMRSVLDPKLRALK
jgi:hypothetical protein